MIKVIYLNCFKREKGKKKENLVFLNWWAKEIG